MSSGRCDANSFIGIASPVASCTESALFENKPLLTSQNTPIAHLILMNEYQLATQHTEYGIPFFYTVIDKRHTFIFKITLAKKWTDLKTISL